MGSESATALVSEEGEETENLMPVIFNQHETSNSALDAFLEINSSATIGVSVRSRIRAPEVDPSLARQQRERFQVLKNWEGVVTSVNGSSFVASMRQTNSENTRAEDEFEIDIDNVAEGDLDLVRDGAVFYLTVGILRPLGEGPQKTTRVIFRRMPRWSSRDIERGEVASSELLEKLRSGVATQEMAPPSEAQEFGRSKK